MSHFNSIDNSSFVGSGKTQTYFTDYSMNYVSYPVDTAAIVTLTIHAASSFKGGDIVISKAFGSSMENKTIPFDGGKATVTVPAASLIGIPIDQQSDDNRFF